MAFVIATGLASIKNKWIVLVLLLAIAGEGIGNQIHTFTIREPHLSMVSIESIFDQHTDRHDPIVINGTIGGDPTPMYFAHRKGITAGNAEFGDPALMEKFKSMGMKYVVILPRMYGDVTLQLPIVADTGYVRIYKLQ